MDEGFQKWLFNIADLPHKYDGYPKIELLIQAMWAINRKGEWEIMQDKYGFCVSGPVYIKSFILNKINNSEQKSLEAALKYIYEETRNEQ